MTSQAPQADRNAPPVVPPIEHRGIRYAEDLDGAELGGRLAAVDIATGQRLWTVQVYRVPDNEAAGIDGIGRHFRHLALRPDGNALLIEDETGARYAVSLADRSVQALSPPPPQEPPAPPKPKP